MLSALHDVRQAYLSSRCPADVDLSKQNPLHRRQNRFPSKCMWVMSNWIRKMKLTIDERSVKQIIALIP